MRRISPDRRVAVATAAIIVLTGAALGVTTARYQSVTDDYERALGTANQAVNAIGALRSNLSSRTAIVATYAITRERRLIERMRTEVREFQRQAAQVRSNGLLGAAELTALARLEAASRQRREAAFAEVFPAVGTPRESSVLVRYASATRRVDRAADRLENQIQARVAEVASAAEDRAGEARTTALVLGVLAIAVALGLAIYATRLIRHLIDRVRSTSSGLTTATGEIHAATTQAAAATAEQSAAVRQATAAAEELSATSVSLADNARSGVGAAERTAETMAEMQDQVSTISERSLALGERTQKIGEVLELLNEIAEQTNLLALNAAIEAARAGDAGRGFAVVAAEIRELSEHSIRSTKSIREIIAAIQDETNATIMATEQGTKRVAEVNELIASTIDVLGRSLEATDQQRDAASQVSETMNEIRSAIEELASEQAQRTATAEKVDTMSRNLQELLDAYGVSSENGLESREKR